MVEFIVIMSHESVAVATWKRPTAGKCARALRSFGERGSVGVDPLAGKGATGLRKMARLARQGEPRY